MIVTAYKPFSPLITTFAQAKVTDLTLITEYRYKKHFYEVGEFSLTVPENDPGDPSLITPGMFLYVADGGVPDSLYVTKVTVSDKLYTFSGYDLKYLLTQRITLFPQEDVAAGTYGYDCRKGSTGEIIEGYVNYNAAQPADSARAFPNFVCVGGTAGIANDTYMSRLQPLGEVVEALCKNAGIGYDVHMNIASSEIWMLVSEGEERRYSGYVFGGPAGNVLSETRTENSENEKSTVWAVNGTGSDNSTVTAVHLNSAKKGYERKETVAEFNCAAGEEDLYARHMAGDLTATAEKTITTDGMYYGTLYAVGDKVKLFDKTGKQTDARIIAAEKSYSGHNRRVNIFFADCDKPVQAKKVLNKLAADDRQREKDIIDQKLDGGGSGGGGGSGVTIDKAVIVQEAEAKYILHNFTQVEYLAGNKIGYAGPGNQIIVGGYVFYKSQNDIIALGSAPYTSAVFAKAGKAAGTMIENVDVYFKVLSVSQSGSASGTVRSDALGMQLSSSYGTSNLSKSGIGFVWNSISPPSDEHPFGYVYGSAMICYYVGSSTFRLGSGLSLYIDFGSIAEYEAAVGLTYEPLTLTRVEDNPTVV